MGLYEWIIKDKAGKTIASLEGATDRSFSTYLNRPGDAQFTLSVLDQKATADALLVGNKEIYVYRGGVLVWGGEMAYRRADLSDNGEFVTVSAKGFLDLLGKRLVGTQAVPRVFENTDIVDIARAIVTESQALTNGSFGITLGNDPASWPADRTYRDENLRDAIEGLSNEKIEDGIDFEVTPAKQFNCYYPQKGMQLASVDFEWGRNITSCFEIQDSSDIANQVVVLGAGEGSSMLRVVRNAPTALQEVYKLRQDTISRKEIVTEATLNEHGDREIAQRQAQRQLIGITVKGDAAPAFGSYAVGDSVRVRVKRGLVDIDGYFRLYGITVTITDLDEETITLVFNPD